MDNLPLQTNQKPTNQLIKVTNDTIFCKCSPEKYVFELLPCHLQDA
jgi:hypothetical protein